MAPPRKRGPNSKGNSGSDLSLGDLVLAKVKGFPAWPAQISRPEDWGRTPDPKKYFVQFFGTQEIAFVAPVDIQPFTVELQKKLQARSKGKTVKYFARALEEICEAFEKSEQKRCVALGDYLGSNSNASALEGMEANGLENDVGANIEVVGNASSSGSSLERCSNIQEGAASKNIFSADEHGFNKKGVEKCSLASPLHSDETNDCKKDLSVRNERIQSGGTSVSPNGGDDLSDDLINRHKSPFDKQKSSSNGYRSKGIHSGQKRKFDDVVENDHAGDSGHLKDGSLHPNSSSKSDKHPSGFKVNKVQKEKRPHDIIKISRDDAFASSKNHGDTVPPKQKSSHVRSERNSVGSSVRSDPSKRKKPVDTVNDAHNPSSLKNEKRDVSSSHLHDGDLSRKSENKGSVNMKGEDHLLSKPPKCSIPSEVPPDGAVTSSVKRRHGMVSDSIEPASDDKRSSLSSFRKSEVAKKRRAIRLYDDDDDEDGVPKTPVHGSSARKLYSSSVPDTVQTTVQIQGNRLTNQTTKGPSKSADALANPSVPSAKSRGDSTSAAPPEVSNKSEKIYSPSLPGLDTNKQLPDSSKAVFVSPKNSSPSIVPASVKNSEDPNISKHQVKVSGTVPHSKGKIITSKDLNIVSDGLSYSQAQVTIKKSRQLSSVEKPKVATKSQVEGDFTVSGRPENLKDRECSLEDSKMDSENSMRHLIAVAQAKRKQAQIQNPFQANGDTETLSAEHQFLSGGSNLMQGAQEVQISTSFASPPVHVTQAVSQNQGIEENDDTRNEPGYQGASGSLSGGTEAAVARDAFEGMIETLSRTKESIGRATRLAVDCAKYGIATEVVDLLIRKLETEPSFHRKVDIFFLVDSITQCSHNQKGIAGASYVSAVQAALPRLLGAAAPSGPSARENRRQCLKVLRLWLERKIIPESVLRRHMNEIGTSNDEISTEISFRRPSRAERAVDDPIREMEGMLVDEYGSNATFQLPGFFSSHAFVVDEEDEDDMLSTPPRVRVSLELAGTRIEAEEACVATPSEKHHHILEDVDVELDMEDVSGHEKDEIAVASTSRSSKIIDHGQQEIEREENDDAGCMTPEGSPPLPFDPPSPLPPLPSSPPPPLPPACPPPPPPPPPVHPSEQPSFTAAANSSLRNPPSSVMYIASHTAQPNQQFLPSHSAFSQGAFHPIPHHNIPTPSSHFTYNKPAVQQQYEHPHPQLYQSPSVGDNRLRFIADDHRRASGEYKADNGRALWMNGGRNPSFSTTIYGAEGYHLPPPERPPVNNSGFQYSAPKLVVPAGVPVTGHGKSRMLPSRPDVSSLNSWRPP